MKHVFILKPNTDIKLVNHIVSKMQGRSYEFRYTKDIDDARIIAKSYQDSEEVCRLYAIGGDGFVHKVANGIVGSRNELVVIPQGTGNDFARTVYGHTNPHKAFDESLDMNAESIDILKVNDFYCINVFCCALDAEIGNIVNLKRNTKYIPKPLQYVYRIIQEVCHIHFFQTKVYDEEVLCDDEVVVAAFCNSMYFGGGVKIGYQASHNDGYIDINIVKNIKKRELPYYLTCLVKETVDSTKDYIHFKKKKVTVECVQSPNIDGETFEPGVYEIECLHNEIKLVCKEQ